MVRGKASPHGFIDRTQKADIGQQVFYEVSEFVQVNS
jgi:hypothetical protein